MASPVITSRVILESYFETGDVPTQDQFADLIASYVNLKDDQVTVFTAGAVSSLYLPEKRFGVGTPIPEARLGIEAEFKSTDPTVPGNNTLISFHKANPIVAPTSGLTQGSPLPATWYFNLDPAGGNAGFNMYQTTAGSNNLFIAEGTGKVGLGTTVPTAKLHLEGLEADGIVGARFLNTGATSQGWLIGHKQNGTPQLDAALSIIEISTGSEKVTISKNGNVGINTILPDIYLNVSGTAGLASDTLSLNEGTGLLMLGDLDKNLVADAEGIQARKSTTLGGALLMQWETLRLQSMGGDILIHSSDPAQVSKKGLITDDGWLGLGVTTPNERVDIDGAIKLGDTSTNNHGTIRFHGNDLEGYVYDSVSASWVWKSLTTGSGGTSLWLPTGSASDIYYPTSGATSNVGIGVVSPTEKLHVSNGILVGAALGTANGTIQYTSGDFFGMKAGSWTSLTGGGGGGSLWTASSNGIYFSGPGLPTRRVGINTNTAIDATLHVFSNENIDPSMPTGNRAGIVNNITRGTPASSLSRIGLEIKNETAWNGPAITFDFGLFVSKVEGFGTPGDGADHSHNIAASLHGNVFIGDTEPVIAAGQDLIGRLGEHVLCIQPGLAPTTEGAGVQLYSDDSKVLNILTGHTGPGSPYVIRLFKGAALTPAAPGSAGIDYNTTARDLINTLQIRVNELELRLQALGLLV